MAVAMVLQPSGSLQAQTGVAPSQTGLFFNDLRARSSQFRTGTVDESAQAGGASGIYDFSRGEYTGETYEERPLGERVPLGDDLSRALGTVSPRSNYFGATKRSAGDYTGASASPYPSTGSYFAPTYISDPFLAGKRNIKLGPVNIGLGLNANVEYNDNITQSGTDKVDDIIAGVYLNVDANYQFSQNNRLTVSAAFGVDHYFNHPELSPRGDEFNINVLPGTTLAFDVKVGDIVFVLYDRVSVRPANQSEFALDDLDVFGVFENDMGVAMNWAINSKTNLSVNFNRSDSWALEDAYSETDRTINSLSTSLAWTPTGTWTVGIEGSFSWIDYDEEFNNDGTTASAGIFFIVPITKSTMVRAAVGWQEFKFDNPPIFNRSVSDADLVNTQAQIDALNTQIAEVSESALTAPDPVVAQQQLAALQAQQQALQEQLAAQTIQKQQDDVTENSRSYDYSDLSDYYYNVTIFNQLNQRISQQLSFGHESSLNTASNFITADYITYGVGFILWRGARLSVSGYYESDEDSGGRLAENVDQWGLDVLLTHRLTEHITIGLGYHFGNTDSETVLRDYEQHAYTLDISYMLSQKMSVGLGYRFLQTDAEDPLQSFDQNRFVLSMNYNF